MCGIVSKTLINPAKYKSGVKSRAYYVISCITDCIKLRKKLRKTKDLCLTTRITYTSRVLTSV